MSLFRYSADVSEGVRKKIKIFVILTVFSFLCLWMRIWYLQILKGENFRGLSENNRVRLVSLPAFRGVIKDRNGETLVSIRPSFNLYVIPEDARDLDRSINLLQQKIDFDRDRLKKNIAQAQSFKEVLIRADIPREKVAFVEENKMRLPGIQIKVEPLRSYVYGDLGSHVLGYLGEISKAKLESLNESGYSQGDMIGKNGLESIYESVLRGEKGYKEVEVDVSGRELKSLRKLPPEMGNNLVLTLDVRIQKVVEDLMTGTPEEPMSGSVVVMKVQTGEILAITSKPSFDPNLFASGISRDHWNRLIRDERHPLQHRSIDGQYPPGSTYKIITALAGLEEGVITPEAKIFCPGHFRLGRGRYRCWKKSGHGAMNLHNAILRSCDVYFYTVGHRLGIDRLAHYARKFGLGNFTGINLKGEKPGLVPSSDWKLRVRKKAWLPGETISASIGQGYNLTTPLQQANMMATVANRGALLKPYLVKRIEDSEGRVQKEFFPEIIKQIDISPENLEAVRKALRGVVNEPHGTGYKARSRKVVVAGKTGTAQVVRMKTSDEEVPEKEIPYQFRDHAWFISFAPFEKPEIAIAIIVEHGGHGGMAAAPIARKIIQAYLKYYPPQERSGLA